MNEQARIAEFLAGASYAVVGASRDRTKYGNKVLRAYLQNDLTVYPVNPHASEVEGLTAYAELAALPEAVDGISVITPPDVTEAIVEQAGELGIRNIWMQPGSESASAIRRAEEFGMNLVAGGPCLLVVLRFRE